MIKIVVSKSLDSGEIETLLQSRVSPHVVRRVLGKKEILMVSLPYLLNHDMVDMPADELRKSIAKILLRAGYRLEVSQGEILVKGRGIALFSFLSLFLREIFAKRSHSKPTGS